MEGTWVLWMGGYLLLREKIIADCKRVCHTVGGEVGERLRAADEARQEDIRSLRQEVKELRELLAPRIHHQQEPAARPVQ
ncbi:hypothetical protein ZWY2020_026018 [Hordeum vulgare]|nr:hypothetical protein ZWY2020_026018 [Hordeum vulgare]